jgi:hypothetical protein
LFVYLSPAERKAIEAIMKATGANPSVTDYVKAALAFCAKEFKEGRWFPDL